MLRSKKVRMTAAGVLVVILREYVPGLDGVNVVALLSPIVSYILAQGWADQGKYKKEVMNMTAPATPVFLSDIPPLVRFAAEYRKIDLGEIQTWNLTLWDVLLSLRNGKEVSVPLSVLLEARVIFPEDEVSS